MTRAREGPANTSSNALQPEFSVDTVTLLVVGMLAVLLLGGVGSMIVPDVVSRLRRIWMMLSPPPM